MLPAPLEDALAQVERRFEEVSTALVSGEPLALEAASVALRQGALDFSALVQRLTAAQRRNPLLKQRLKVLSNAMVSRRESLIRRTVLVERELKAILPAVQGSTYEPKAGPYGSPGRPVGAFKGYSA